MDRTPYYNERGGISLSDRTRAVLKYGRDWLSEMEAQKSILPVLEKHLDRKYTLLRNTPLPGLEVSIPLLLIGPAGLYVFNVTDLAGIYRAKGDQWGTISGATLKPEKINLLTRTEQMALAVQQYLKENGRLDIPGVESVLVFTNPSIHIDSVRPIVRVVQCDALERLIISISEAAPVISQDLALKAVNLITNPIGQQLPDNSPVTKNTPVTQGENSREIPEVSSLPEQTLVSSPAGDNSTLPGEEPEISSLLARDISQPAVLGYVNERNPMETPLFESDSTAEANLEPEASKPSTEPRSSPLDDSPNSSTSWQIPAAPWGELESQPGLIPLQSEISPEPYSSPLPESLFPGFTRPVNPVPMIPDPVKKKPVSGRQWLILGGLALFWLILAGILLFFIIKDLL
jgi:hypothetical protein